MYSGIHQEYNNPNFYPRIHILYSRIQPRIHKELDLWAPYLPKIKFKFMKRNIWLNNLRKNHENELHVGSTLISSGLKGLSKNQFFDNLGRYFLKLF
jgi:hypothetical protein